MANRRSIVCFDASAMRFQWVHTARFTATAATTSCAIASIAASGHVVGGQRVAARARSSVAAHAGGSAPSRSDARASPLSGQVGERPDLLRRPGRQRRLGAQLDDGLRRRHPTVPCDVLGDELVLLELDLAGAARELGDQVVADAGDLPLRVPVGAALAQLPLDAEVAG